MVVRHIGGQKVRGHNLKVLTPEGRAWSFAGSEVVKSYGQNKTPKNTNAEIGKRHLKGTRAYNYIGKCLEVQKTGSQMGKNDKEGQWHIIAVQVPLKSPHRLIETI